jgi:hypothetical protein
VRAVGEEWNDDRCVAAARAGDFEELITILNSIIGFAEEDPTFETLLSPDMCRVLIKILKGEIRRPKKRPPDKLVAARRFFISFEVEYLKRHGMPIEAAVAAAAEQFGVSTRLVYKERKAHPIDDSAYETIMRDDPGSLSRAEPGLLYLLFEASEVDGTITIRWVQHFFDLIVCHREGYSLDELSKYLDYAREIERSFLRKMKWRMHRDRPAGAATRAAKSCRSRRSTHTPSSA